MTIQLDAEQLRVVQLDALAWPITWRWHMRAPWGDTRQEFTVDCPSLAGSIGPSMNLGLGVWSRAIAPAISHDVELVGWDTVCWKIAPAGLPMGAIGARGLQPGRGTERSQAGCVIMHTGDDDRLARRRLMYPCIPRGWVVDGLMTGTGMEALQTIARGVYIGLASHWTGGPYRWLLAYPELLPATAANGNGVAFRTVEWLRCCLHVEPAPALSSEPWP